MLSFSTGSNVDLNYFAFISQMPPIIYSPTVSKRTIICLPVKLNKFLCELVIRHVLVAILPCLMFQFNLQKQAHNFDGQLLFI